MVNTVWVNDHGCDLQHLADYMTKLQNFTKEIVSFNIFIFSSVNA